MPEIIQFPDPRKDKGIWVCQCGCVTFYACVRGELECAGCEAIVTGPDGDWFERLPEPNAGELKVMDDDSNHTVVNFQGEGYSMARMIRNLDPKDTSCLIAIDNAGDITAIGPDVDDAETADWLWRRVADAYALIAKKWIKNNG